MDFHRKHMKLGYQVWTQGGCSFCDAQNQLTQSQKPDKTTFKVGDMVRVRHAGIDAPLIGKTVKVVSVDGDSVWLEGAQGPWDQGTNSLELVKSSKEKSQKMRAKIDLKALDRVSLRPEAKKDIIALLQQGSKQDIIFDKWGLGKVIEYGKGMTALFWGPPGTGKTQTAHCMAKALNKELMVVSVGQIQSSMAGETNKNIEEAFANAKKGNKVLLLDEADSFVGDRKHLGMILGSEVNTLLTEIEKFEGFLILTTNMIGNLDPALERRLALIVEFKNPTRAERLEIWKMLLPKKFPLGENVNLDILAEYQLTGGFIKNVILHAARLAVAESRKAVHKEHFDAAIERVKASQGRMGTRNPGGVVDYVRTGSH